jgi:tetratricopeptide (TPR) repeat protein
VFVFGRIRVPYSHFGTFLRVSSAALLGLAFVFNASIADAKGEAEAAKFFLEGRALEWNGDNAGAIEKYKAAIQSDDNCFEAHRAYQIVTSAGSAEKREEIAGEYAKGLEQNPKSAMLTVLCGRLLRDNARREEHFKKAAELDPKFHWTFVEWGGIYSRCDSPTQPFSKSLKDDAAKAVELFDKAIALKGDCAEAHARKGIALLDALNQKDAEASLKRAVSLDKTCITAHYGLALIAFQNGKFDDAIKMMEGVLKREGKADAALQKKIDGLIVQLGSDDVETRERATRELTGIGPAASAALQKALRSKDPEVKARAESIVAKITALVPHFDGLSLLVRCYHAKGDYKKGAELRAALLKANTDRTIVDKQNLNKKPCIDLIWTESATLAVIEEPDQSKGGGYSLFMFAVFPGTDRLRPDVVCAYVKFSRLITLDCDSFVGGSFFLEETNGGEHSTYDSYGNEKPKYEKVIGRVKEILKVK